MNNQYIVKGEDGMFRMFDMSQDGLKDAIEIANDIRADVICERDGESESVWSFEESGRSVPDEPSDHYLSDAAHDEATLNSVYGPDDDGDSYIGECNDGFCHH